MSNQALISVQGITKRFDRKPVLRGVDLAVAPGEIVTLLGANGAGKTTLMRIISGLSAPDRGEVQLGGASFATGGHELRRYIGLVSHTPLLYDNLSGEENLAFFARLYDLVEPQARIEWALHAVDLWPRRRDAVRTYSRGMTQRLAIARAILHNPPVLLLDEPDTGLDQAGADLLHGLLQQLDTAQRAVLFTTHNLSRARAWADRVALLVDGRIVQMASTVGMTDADLQKLYREAGRPA
ncbi:MAG: heme ABC exporter ATP-binding protein CcmA [Caldilineaceae bacterium]|nr:heme ABC exporter ATP-binding protein CcmA [Caldilineaceae bacterium]